MLYLNIACILGLHLLIGGKIKKMKADYKVDFNTLFFNVLVAGFGRKKSILFLILNSIQIILLIYFLFIYKFDLSKVDSYIFLYCMLTYILFNVLMLALSYGFKKFKELTLGFRAACLFMLIIGAIANNKFDLRADEINASVFVVFLYMIIFNYLFFLFKINNKNGVPGHAK